ncbi:MAG: hypothetical protein ACRC4W_08915 [Treponemataceae bacterium]
MYIQKKISFLILSLWSFSLLFALADTEETSFLELPNGYEGITLGSSFESTKEALIANSIFGFRGDRDVSLLPTQNRILIETVGNSYIGRSWFQFFENALYVIIINFNTKKMDFHSIFTALNNKYGEPVSVTPQKILWENEKVMMVLERPLTLKYIDVAAFNRLQEDSSTKKSATEIIRQEFLDSL